MTEVLSQDEIDRLLMAINADDTGTEVFRPAGYSGKSFGIDDFEKLLTGRKFEPEKPYGIFEEDVTMCNFFKSGNSETVLADIERKNVEQNMGNIAVPNTNIKLINYSVCPKCKAVFSFKDLVDYYKAPKPDPMFKNKGSQIREDTRVCCSECGGYFLPALVIVDRTPRNEVQFLCWMQTVDAIEKFFLDKDRRVLSRNKGNILRKSGFVTLRNDVELKELASKPTLVTNMLQYTPVNLIPNLIDGSNIKKGDMLFGRWHPVNF